MTNYPSKENGCRHKNQPPLTHQESSDGQRVRQIFSQPSIHPVSLLPENKQFCLKRKKKKKRLDQQNERKAIHEKKNK